MKPFEPIVTCRYFSHIAAWYTWKGDIWTAVAYLIMSDDVRRPLSAFLRPTP
jgi:hypothetical protein